MIAHTFADLCLPLSTRGLYIYQDCLERQTTGRIQLRCSSRVTLWSTGQVEQGTLGQHRKMRQDLFSISRSVLFVPIISAATLEQWSFEKRVPKRYLRKKGCVTRNSMCHTSKQLDVFYLLCSTHSVD
jgi:hypothetical protein